MWPTSEIVNKSCFDKLIPQSNSLEGNHIVNELLPVGRQLDALGRIGMHVLGGGDLPDLGRFARLARGGLTGLDHDFGNGHGCVEMWSAGS